VRAYPQGVDTLRRPDTHRPSIRPRELLADALLVVGCVLMVLGIYEIGGLLDIGLGFVVLWIGALAALADMTRSYRKDDDEFLRITDNF
jgi:hypothetical protein